jgi:hypothetical protein
MCLEMPWPVDLQFVCQPLEPLHSQSGLRVRAKARLVPPETEVRSTPPRRHLATLFVVYSQHRSICDERGWLDRLHEIHRWMAWIIAMSAMSALLALLALKEAFVYAEQSPIPARG